MNKETKYMVWVDLGYDGWTHQDFKSLKEARKYASTRTEKVYVTKIV